MNDTSQGQSPSRLTTSLNGSTRFVTSLSDFHLPQRSPTAAQQNASHHYFHQQLSPGSTSSSSVTGFNAHASTSQSPHLAGIGASEGENGNMASMPPLFLRRAAAVGNGARMRRTSMLGREVLGNRTRHGPASMSEEEEERIEEDDKMQEQISQRATMRPRGPLQREESPTLRSRSFAARERRQDRMNSESMAMEAQHDIRSNKGHEGDDDMEMDTGDVTLSEIETIPNKDTVASAIGKNAASTAALNPSTPPMHATSMLSSSHDSSSSPLPRTGVVRRAVNRRANLMPKDRGMLRVAATLRDESRPSDVEIASEAKLQRKLGPDSDVPFVNRFGSPAQWGASGSFVTGAGDSGAFPMSSGGGGSGNDRWGDEDDFSHALHRADEVLSDFGDESSDEGASTSKTMTATNMAPLIGLGVGQTAGQSSSSSMFDANGDDDVDTMRLKGEAGREQESHHRGISIPGNGALSNLSTSASNKASLWLGFREGSGSASRQSPGVERAMTKSRSSTVSMHTPFDAQSLLSTSMEVEPSPSSPANALPTAASTSNGPANQVQSVASSGVSGVGPGNFAIRSPSLWGRSAKRKVGDERFDPYASSALYKRRAVSPIALMSSSSSSSNAAASCSVPPSGGMSATVRASTPTSNPALISPFALQTYNSAALPIPTPLSIPSPTITANSYGQQGVGAGAGAALSTSPYPRASGARSSSSSGAPNAYFPTAKDSQSVNSSAVSSSAGNGGSGSKGVAIPGSSHAHAPSMTSTMWAAKRSSRANSPAASALLASANSSMNGGSNNNHNYSSSNNGGGSSSANAMTTRPSTPTNSTYASIYSGPGPSPSLLSTSAGKLGTPGSAATPGPSSANKGGSGPGYGSGALGLSLGGGSKGLREEEEEEMEDEGMLGDVSAIQLG